jgi:hypothetical protein
MAKILTHKDVDAQLKKRLAELDEKYHVAERRAKLEKKLGILHVELPEHNGDFSDHGTFTEFMGRLHSKGKLQTKEEKEWELYIAELRDAQLEAKGLEPKWIKNWGLEKRLAELNKKRKKETKNDN